MPVVISQYLLNVFVQLANKMGLKKINDAISTAHLEQDVGVNSQGMICSTSSALQTKGRRKYKHT
jgi:hypothetical protein